ncbi:MAG: AzlD domain-containing protein [Actinomycetota bacterium]|nr:AzlD domain-containing protein [Actinomycetota bacterium]
MNAVAGLLVASLATYAIRLAAVVAVGAKPLPARVERALRHAAVAVLASFVMSGFVGRDGVGALTAAAALASVAAVVVARLTRNITLAVLVAALVYAATSAVVG